MILGLEIAMTIGGIYMLCTGKSWGKLTFRHWQLRLVGAFLVTLLPLVFLLAAVVGVVYAMNHAELSPDMVAQRLRWPVTGMEAACLAVYGAVAAIWMNILRRRVERAGAAPAQPLPAPNPAGVMKEHPMIPQDRQFGRP